MKWKDKPLLNKIVEIVMLLSIGAYFGLSSERAKGGDVPVALPKFCIAVVFLCLGISYWKINRKAAIIYYAMAAGITLLTLILL